MSLPNNQQSVKIEFISESEDETLDDNCDYIIADLDNNTPPVLANRSNNKGSSNVSSNSNRSRLQKSCSTNNERLTRSRDKKTKSKSFNIKTINEEAKIFKNNQQLLPETHSERNGRKVEKKKNTSSPRILQNKQKVPSEERKTAMNKLAMMSTVLLHKLDMKQDNKNNSDTSNKQKENDFEILTESEIKKEIIETDDSSTSSSSSSDNSSSEDDSGTSDSEEDSSGPGSVDGEKHFDASAEAKVEIIETQPVYYLPYLPPKTENTPVVAIQEATVLPYKGQKRGPKRKKPIKVRDPNKPMRKRPGEPFVPIECPDCDKTFKYISLLRQHQVVHSTDSLFDCEECGKGFKRRTTLNEHRARHTTGRVDKNDQTFYDDRPSSKSKPKYENIHICEFCSRSCSSFSTLELHIRTHTNERPYPCNTCPKSFKNSYELKLHIRTHTLEKPFTCDLCNRSFSVARTLKIHRMRHAGEKPFECTEDNCGKKFTIKLELQRHIARHHNGPEGLHRRPVVCEECGRQFSHIGILKDHLLIHTGIKPFQCPFCDIEFRQANHLDYHIRVHK